MFKDLDGRVKTVKLLGENLGINLRDRVLGNDCLDTTPKLSQRTTYCRLPL